MKSANHLSGDAVNSDTHLNRLRVIASFPPQGEMPAKTTCPPGNIPVKTVSCFLRASALRIACQNRFVWFVDNSFF
jgi:hypothetical protein